MRVVYPALAIALSCSFSLGAFAQDIQQSRGLDPRVDYPSLARFGPWDDRNYNLSAEDLELLAPNEEELFPGIPLFFRVELRKEWPRMQRTGPAQYPRAANKLFEIRYGGFMRNGVIDRPEDRAAAERTPVTIDDQLKLNDVLRADEITVEINPVDPMMVIAGSNTTGGQKMYYSLDGGANWGIGEQGDADGVLDNTCCDPSVGWSSDGTVAYAASLSSGAIGVNFYRSTTSGVTWTSPIALTSGGSDKEFLHVDISATSPYIDNVYLTWHDLNVMQFARSIDLGLNFTIKAFDGTVGQLVLAQTGIGSDITTDASGRIYYFYGAFSNGIMLLKSTDGGASFLSPITVSSTNGNFDWPIPAMETRRAWIYAAADCDTSGGPFDGTVYCAWTDTSAPESSVASMNHTRIVVARSTDQGASWQTSTPHPTADIDTVDRFNQWLTVDDSGIVHVVYYSTKNSVNRTGVDLYYANSDNGGVTWNPERRISTVTSDNVTNVQEWGDYNGISVIGDQIIATWTDNRPPGSTTDTDVYVGLMMRDPRPLLLTRGLPLLLAFTLAFFAAAIIRAQRR
ncbi:MAG: exo-alpha-sialidase [Candidatus Hydrogenedentes bacterium]|nr:exo-alpha-sialidase [Candidatus Hydrogenedentota bacterium]